MEEGECTDEHYCEGVYRRRDFAPAAAGSYRLSSVYPDGFVAVPTLRRSHDGATAGWSLR